MTGTKPHIQETRRTQSQINTTPKFLIKYIIFKTRKIKDKDKTLKEARVGVGEETLSIKEED